MVSLAETAKVISTNGRMATVRIEGGSTCRRCGLAAMGLCRAGAEGMKIEVENPLSAKIGDIVMLGLQKRAKTIGFFYVYGLPIIVFFIAAVAGLYIGGEGIAVAVPFLALGLSLWFSIKKIRRMEQSERLFIKRIVSGEEFAPETALTPEGADYLRAYSPNTRLNM